MKYITISTVGIIRAIAIQIPGLTMTDTILVVKSVSPTGQEFLDMTKKQQRDWIVKNNHRMQLICDFMNENDL